MQYFAGEGGKEKGALTLRQTQIRHVNLSIVILTHRICFIIFFIKRESRSAPRAFELDPRVNYRSLGSRKGVSRWACLALFDDTVHTSRKLSVRNG